MQQQNSLFTSDIQDFILFDGNARIRKERYNDERYFSVVDIVGVLSGSDRARKYRNDLKTKLAQEGFFEVSEKIGQLKMPAPDGKLRLTDAANTETTLRIIQSIPSPNAEPLKRRLANL
jgi:hypothetical protein